MTDKTLITVRVDEATMQRIEGMMAALSLTESQVCQMAISEACKGFYRLRDDDPAKKKEAKQ